jgi:hypothetical protein
VVEWFQVIASASVKSPYHVTLIYASRAMRILGRTVKLRPGFYWLEKKIPSRATVSVTR